jgi:multidrug resistance protein
MSQDFFNLSITKQEFKLLCLTILLAISGVLGLDIHLAALPSIMLELQTNKHAMQQSVTIFMLGAAVSMLIYGPLSDKIGRKPVILFGLCLYCLSSFLTVFVYSIKYFLLLRVIQGLGAGVAWGLARIIAADIMQNERLAAIGSYFTLFLSLTIMFSPVLGGYIQHWFGWRAIFIVLSCLILIVLLSYIFFFEETNKYKDINAFKLKVIMQNYIFFFKNHYFSSAVLLGGFSLSINIVYVTLCSFIFQEQFHTSPIAFGWLTAFVGATCVLTKAISPFFIMRSTNTKLMKSGINLILISGVFLLIPNLMGFINIPIVLTGVSIAMVV